jgi:conjugative transfer region protein TrbK
MRRRFSVPALARVIGYVAIAIVIAIAALHVRHGAEAPRPASAMPSDALAAELARCRTLGVAATNDTACSAAWAESRRRFFTYGPADTSAAGGQER